jgi:hypothetical protein
MNAYPDKEVQKKTNNTPTGNKISGHRKCLSVNIAHRMTRQPKLDRADFKQCNNGLRLQEFNTATGVAVFCVKGFKFSSWECVLNATFCKNGAEINMRIEDSQVICFVHNHGQR